MDYLKYYLSSEGQQTNPFVASVLYFATFIGMCQLAKFSYKTLTFLHRHLIRSSYDLYKRYAKKGSWAVVTGGSDGIGLQYCKELAQKGFNICIIARNEDKMKQRLEEIKELSGREIQTRYVVADLAKLSKISDYEYMGAALKDIDIAMLILNAGWSVMGPFVDLRPEEIEQIVTINAVHPTYLCKTLLPQMLNRPQRGAIIITSSGLGSFPASGFTTYSASKAFSSFLGQALNYELKDKLDVLSFEAGETSTNLLKRKPSMRVLAVERVIKPSFRDLGRQSLTYGHLIHDASMGLVNIFPISFIQRMMFSASKKVIKLVRDKEEREKKTQ